MLKAVAEFIASLSRGDTPAEPAHDEVQLSAAALVVRLARIDGAFSTREDAWIRQAVQTYTGLVGEDAEHFLAMAEALARESDDLAEQVELLRRRLPPDQKLGLVALLWRTAMADGVLHEFEEALVSRVAEQLGLGAEEAAAVRDAALQR